MIEPTGGKVTFDINLKEFGIRDLVEASFDATSGVWQFLIWDAENTPKYFGGLYEFFEFLNSIHPGIQWTIEMEERNNLASLTSK